MPFRRALEEYDSLLSFGAHRTDLIGAAPPDQSETAVSQTDAAWRASAAGWLDHVESDECLLRALNAPSYIRPPWPRSVEALRGKLEDTDGFSTSEAFRVAAGQVIFSALLNWPQDAAETTRTRLSELFSMLPQ